MCQMEIHAHAQTTTMLQAVSHNLGTSASDLDTLAATLRARGADDALVEILAATQDMVARMSKAMLALYEHEVRNHPHVDTGHATVGSERVGLERSPAQQREDAMQ